MKPDTDVRVINPHTWSFGREGYLVQVDASLRYARVQFGADCRYAQATLSFDDLVTIENTPKEFPHGADK